MRFSDYHPGINACFFLAVLAGTVLFRHPVYLLLSFCTAGAWLVEQKGAKSLGFVGIAALIALAFALWYGSYHHFGVTPLWTNAVGNEITLESLLYGLMLGGMIGAVLVWLACLNFVFTTDKTVYLAGRIAPKLGLFLAILLRLVPRIRAQWRRNATARRGIGKGGWRYAVRLFSGVVTWTLDSLVMLSDAMRSRGGMLKGRTAYSLYRFDRRDRSFVIALFTLVTLCLMAFLLGQTRMTFSPKLHCLPITGASVVFYAAWAALCLLPLAVDLAGERKMA